MELKTLLIGLAIAALTPLLQAKTVQLAAMEYPPHYGQDLIDSGALTEIVTQAYKLRGSQVEVLFVPWSRALSWAEQGKIDGIIGPWYTEERAKVLLYSEPIYPNEMQFYKATKSKISFDSYQDLAEQELVLGSVRGYVQVNGLAESGINISYVNTDGQNFKLLEKGRIDLMVVDKDYASYLLSQPEYVNLVGKIEPMVPILETRQQFLTISKNTNDATHKLTDFNLGLEQLKMSGQFDDILKKHGID